MIDLIEKIIKIPRIFNSSTDISIYDLLKNTGYFENTDKISHDLIKKYLESNTYYIDDWIFYSEDKRCETGWYIIKNNINKFTVGYMDNNGNDKYIEYDNIIDACSNYIINEIDNIKNSIEF